MTLDPNAKIRPRDNVFAREFDGEIVLLDLSGGAYYGLDALASRVWREMCDGKSLRQVVSDVLPDYHVEEATLMKDVLALATEWVEKNLVQQVTP